MEQKIRTKLFGTIIFILLRGFLESFLLFVILYKVSSIFFGPFPEYYFIFIAIIFFIFLWLRLTNYLKKTILHPLSLICSANDRSDIFDGQIDSVVLSEHSLQEFKEIVAFREKMKSVLIQKKKDDIHAKPLDSCSSEMDSLIDGVIEALTQANIYNDNDTGNHMDRLGLYSKFLAEKKGLDSHFIKEIRRYAPLHDVGKIGIPDSILKKEGPLNSEEWVIMKTHSKIGYDILKSVGMSPIAQNIALYHHENWIGTGYPEGLKGEDIPIEARLVSIADVFDALINKRVYKEAFIRSKVEKIMLYEIARKFDPDLGKTAYESLDALYEIFHKNKEIVSQ